MLWASLLADLIVVFHATYVSFVVFGLAGDPARRRVSLELGPQLLVPRDPSDRDRDRGRSRRSSGIPCPLTVLGTQLRTTGRADRLRGRLPRPLGPSVDLLPTPSPGSSP